MVDVTDNSQSSRFEARTDDGRLAGIAQYRREDEVLVLTHTEVDDAHEGEGIGSALASGALDRVRADGLRVKVECPFIEGYVERHPDYRDLLV